MPELPEVETTCRGLSTVLEGNKIDTVQKLRAGLRIPFPSDIEKIMSGAFVVSVIRKAKYVCIYLSNGYISIIHLGMSGRIIITSKSNELQKHDHFVIDMSNGDRIVLNDPRRFGLVTLIKDTESPLDSRSAPIEAAAIPFPSDETTPPVMKMYLV